MKRISRVLWSPSVKKRHARGKEQNKYAKTSLWAFSIARQHDHFLANMSARVLRLGWPRVPRGWKTIRCSWRSSQHCRRHRSLYGKRTRNVHRRYFLLLSMFPRVFQPWNHALKYLYHVWISRIETSKSIVIVFTRRPQVSLTSTPMRCSPKRVSSK